ncbi:MAG TPA: hypothetical protein VKN99_25135 [Polyangia bacterium]|nr:hypothetical protein [Polyangia bacterium]
MTALFLFLQVAAVEPEPEPPAQPPEAEAPDPCGTDARCRIEHARAIDAERRRAEYFRALAAYAQALEQAQLEALPHRERHPLGADFMYSSNLEGYAGVIGYSLAWPVRVEFFGGTGKKLDYSSMNDAQNGTYSYTDGDLHLKSFGFQGRFYLAPWVVSPVFTLGLGWSSGSYTLSSYVNQNGRSSQSSAEANVGVHTLYSGVGVDFQWNWLHVAVGYRLAWAFYVGASDPKTDKPIPMLPETLSSSLENNMHGFAVEIGARY